MDDEPGLVDDAGANAFDESEDLVAYVKHVNCEANAKCDRIQAEHDSKVEAMSRRIQSQLKKQADQMTQSTEKVDPGKEHTERM